MSRRKQSNPKSIKVSTDSPETEGADKDADNSRDDIHLDVGGGSGRERQQQQQQQPMKSQDSHRGSPSESADSPDHIDVVSMGHSPHRPSPPPSSSLSKSPTSQSSPSMVAVKVEKEEAEDGRGWKVEEEEKGSRVMAGGVSGSQAADTTATQGLVRHLQLPSDVLYMKEVEVMVHGTPTPSWMICSAIPLPKGSSLGPFSGHMVSSENIRVGNLILEFHSKTGHVVLVNVAGQSGAWLSLLRPAVSELTRNALVYLEGGRIWCEIVSDVEIGMEIRATFVFDFEDLSLADRELSLTPISPSSQNTTEKNTASSSSPSQPPESAVLQQPSPGHAALIYGCPFCGVRFSSPRTLQGHLSYYCSKKKAEHIVSPRPRSRRSSESQGAAATNVSSEMAHIKQEADADTPKTVAGSHPPETSSEAGSSGSSGTKRPAPPPDSNGSSRDGGSPPAKAARVESPSAVQCPLCSYCADKPASLNRHMRIHNRPPEPAVKSKAAVEERGASAAPASASATPSSATYCKECNIQFSSLSTYQCHKKHYCSQRNMGRGAADRKQQDSPPQFGGLASMPALGLPGSLSAAAAAAASMQLATLGQNGLLFPPGHGLPAEAGALSAGAAIMPGGPAAVILTAPVMTATGITSMAIPLSTVLQSIHAVQSAAAASTPVSPVSATSPRKSSSPKALDASPRSAPEEAHQSKSPKRPYSSDAESSVKELPLDLSTKKSDSEEGGGSPDKLVKREREEEEEASPVSAAAAAASVSGASPGAGRLSGADGLDLPCGPAAAKTPSTPTPIAGLPPHLLTPPLLPPFMPLHNIAAALPVKPPAHAFGGIPPGSSKCTDCNIIFYKHDNFLIHKQHYCSGKKLRPPVTASVVSPRAADPVTIKAEPSATVTSTADPGTSQSPASTASPGNESEPAFSGQPHYLPSPAIKPLPVLGGLVPTTASEDIYYKFFCIPCRIKFSSATNLKAHKEYYCPHGKNSEHSIIAQRPSGEIISTGCSDPKSPASNGSSPSPGQYCCTQCRSTFTSSRLLKLHLCSAEVAQASLLKCSHCDYVTHTDKRLAEHMKVHNPTSAYRCTLCGYRGNTVRGMRMHGKTHTDNGEDFTDDHMIEFQEPPLVPIQTNRDFKASQGPFSVEAELLRLKNEPYKRRRSRKAYEKVDILVPLDDPQSCSLCGECFPDPRSLILHVRLHEMSNQYMQDLSHCNQCDFASKSVEELRAHMEVSHGLIPREEKENHPQSASPGKTSPPDRGSFERVSSAERKSPPLRVKEEPADSDCDNREHSQGSATEQGRQTDDSMPTECVQGEGTRDSDDGNLSVDRCPRNSEDVPECMDTDIDKTSSSAEMAPIKTEPELDRDEEDSCNDPPLPITFATSSPTSPPRSSDSPSSSPRQRPALSPPTNAGPGHGSLTPSPPISSSSSSVKVEPDLLPSSHSLNPPPSRAVFPRFFVDPVRSPCPLALGGSAQDRNGKDRAGDSAATPYCQNCDISFTYHSTFIAHKKYYCTGRAGLPPSATA